MPPDTETPTDPAELSIPPVAVEAYFVCGCSESGVRAGYRSEALAVVVAAELRRMAEEQDQQQAKHAASFAKTAMLFSSGASCAAMDAAAALRARADQLDPKGGMT